MGSTLEDAPEVGAEELDEAALRAALNEVLQREGLKLAHVAPQIGRPMGTLSNWKNDTYAGDTQSVALAVHEWLTKRAQAARTRTLLPAAPGFVMTKTASEIFELLEFAQHAPAMATVTAGSGVGKTTAFESYRGRLHHTVWIAQMQKCHRTLGSVLQEIQRALGMSHNYRVPDMVRAIVTRMRNTQGLLIVDEAQHLPTDALDQIRGLYDASGVGIVLGGSNVLLRNLGAERRQEDLAQIFSRIGMRFNRARPLRADIAMILDAWSIEDKQVRDMLTAIALRPGASRVMTMVLRIACSLAAADGLPRPAAAHVELANLQIAAPAMVA